MFACPVELLCEGGRNVPLRLLVRHDRLMAIALCPDPLSPLCILSLSSVYQDAIQSVAICVVPHHILADGPCVQPRGVGRGESFRTVY